MAVLGELVVKIKASAKEFSSELKTAGKSMDKFSGNILKNEKRIADASKKMIAVSAGLGAAILYNVKQAADAEKVDALLANALKNIGIESEEATNKLTAMASAVELASGFGDEDLKNAMKDLINITGDYNVALNQTQLVADLARNSNISLETSAKVLGMAYIGQTGMLTRYGIVLGKGVKGTEALKAIQDKFGGASSAFMETFEGQWQLFQQSIVDVGEALGKNLLPKFTKSLDTFNTFLQALASSEPSRAKLYSDLLVWTAGISGVTGALGFLIIGLVKLRIAIVTTLIPAITSAYAVMAAHPFVAIAGGIAILGTAITNLIIKMKLKKAEDQAEGATLRGQIALREKKINKIKEEGRARGEFNQQQIQDVTRLRHEITLITKVAVMKEKEGKARKKNADSIKKEKSELDKYIDGLKKEEEQLETNVAQAQVMADAASAAFETFGAAMIQTNANLGDALKAGVKELLGMIIDYYMKRLMAQMAIYVSQLFDPLTMATAPAGIATTGAQIAGLGALKAGIAMMADGGIANRPTMAMIAEAGTPEAVIPLDKLGPMMRDAVEQTNINSNISITINTPSIDANTNWDALTKSKIQPALERNLKLNGRRL